MIAEERVITNRVFLLGLDELYREAMKRHERDELLRCARETADALSVPPADVPIEGYYTEDELLTEYFRLMRALQQVPKEREAEVASLDALKRLKQVAESPLFGEAMGGEFLFGGGHDVLFTALDQCPPDDWSVDRLTQAAFQLVLKTTEYSLVALAALSKDAVVLCALRESVVLYAAIALGCPPEDEEPQYIWRVDDELTQRAVRFIDTFNALFDESLPTPSLENAERYWDAWERSNVVGRCVRIGTDIYSAPERQYHWAITCDNEGKMVVKEFWDTEVWTTERFRGEQYL